MDQDQAGCAVKLFADLLEPDGHTINADLWETRAATSTAVGKCGCGLFLTARPAEQPPYSAVTYRDVYCPAGHEASIVGTYKGPAIGIPAGGIDRTTARHSKED